MNSGSKAWSSRALAGLTFRLAVPKFSALVRVPMRKIIMVKKLLSSGEPCAKCAQAEELLKARGVWDQIDEVVWAKESDPMSVGSLLGKKYGVDLAPFFIVQRAGQPDQVHQSTLRLLKELSAPAL